jgi:hypothetical protein
MARTGYLGGSIIRPGGGAPPRVGPVLVSNIARPTGLGSHVANIKRQNIVMDAATISISARPTASMRRMR